MGKSYEKKKPDIIVAVVHSGEEPKIQNIQEIE